MDATSVAAWSAALDEIEASLRAADALIRAADASDPSAVAWSVPDGLGPVPADLVPRSHAVLASVLAVAERTAAARDAIAAELAEAARAPRRRPGASDDPPAPRLVDHPA